MFDWLLDQVLQRCGGYQKVLRAVLRHIKEKYTEQNEPTDIAYFFEQALAAAEAESEHCSTTQIAELAEHEIEIVRSCGRTFCRDNP